VPFEGAVAGGVGAVMCSYNKVNGTYACENEDTMNDLRNTYGFDGYFMSDWDATHSVHDIESGLNQDESLITDCWNQDNLKDIAIEYIDRAITQILKSMIRIGIIDDKNDNSIENIVTTKEHLKIAQEINEEGIILLKNDNKALPLDGSKKQDLLILGEDDLAFNPQYHGTGSSDVHRTTI